MEIAALIVASVDLLITLWFLYLIKSNNMFMYQVLVRLHNMEHPDDSENEVDRHIRATNEKKDIHDRHVLSVFKKK